VRIGADRNEDLDPGLVSRNMADKVADDARPACSYRR
jgi:hypothetical protein